MSIDRDPMCSRMIRVSDEVHDMLCQTKIIPQEPYNNCLKRIIAENNYLKRHYIAEAPRESMCRDLHNFVLNPDIPEEIIGSSVCDHIGIWNKTHPNDPLKPGEVIHHINGDHDDNRPENLVKTTRSNHGSYHKDLNAANGITKNVGSKSEIVFGFPNELAPED